MNSTPNVLSYLRALLEADLLVLIKNRRMVIISLVLPFYILFITSIQNKSKLGSPDLLVFLAITIGLLSTSIMGYALIVARDRENGVFQRLRVTPAPLWTIMFSRLLLQVAANLAIALLVLIVGSRWHHLSLSVGQDIWVLLVATLAGAMFLSIGQALVGLVKSATTVNAVGSLLFAALLLTGLLGPSGTLGSTVKSISVWTPVGAVTSVFQSAIHLAAWNSHAWLSLLACFGYIIVCAAIGIKWFQWTPDNV